MKKYIFTLFAAALAFVACNKESSVNEPAGGRTVTVTAALESAATKVTTGSEVGKFAWEAGDVIGVWTGSEFTPFTIDPSSVGGPAGKFTGTIPAGGSLGFAVYPYSEADTYEETEEGKIYTSNYNTSWWGDYKSTVHLYAPAASSENEYKFAHLCAYAMITIQNLRADCKYAYLESPSGAFFLTGGQKADLSAEYPKFTSGAQEQGFVPLPEDHSKIVIYAPIMPGLWNDGKAFKVKFFRDLGWSWEYGKGELEGEPVIDHVGKLVTGGVINRGEIVVLPPIVFEGGEASGLSATIEGGLSWLSGTTIGLWDGRSFIEKTVASGGVAVGEFEGDVPSNATIAVSPVQGVTIEDNTLKVEKSTWEYTLGSVLYGTVGEPSSPVYLANVDFKHLGATVRVSLKNLPEDAAYMFIETGANSKYIYNSATADLSAETPVLVADAVNDWCFAPIPAHSGTSVTFDMPIAPGTYERADPMFNVELYTEVDWGKKIEGSKQNKNLTTTGGVIARGDVFELEFAW